jgi:octaprenyl-diphosphate synthase
VDWKTVELTQIYQPIEKELEAVESALRVAFAESEYPSILELGSFVAESPGKRIRPALVILSAKVASREKAAELEFEKLVMVATAVELIHVASLVHDDVIDKATMRHNRPTVNSKWRDDVSVIFGDYVYSKALELISKCSNTALLSCMSEAMKTMCEGELLQVCMRGNVNLSRSSYLAVIKKKTASFFAACCHLGTIISNRNSEVQAALKEYGMNFGIAFQIVDDCRDIISEEKDLGKHPGQDVFMREVTLPLMNLLDTVGQAEKARLANILASGPEHADLEGIRKAFISSDAVRKTKEVASHYAECAKQKLTFLDDSDYKVSLNSLADYVIQRTF